MVTSHLFLSRQSRFTRSPSSNLGFCWSQRQWQRSSGGVIRHAVPQQFEELVPYYVILAIGKLYVMVVGDSRKKLQVFISVKEGFPDYKRNISPACHQYRPEVSLALMPFVHPKGYSIEILRADVGLGDEFISIKEFRKCLVCLKNISYSVCTILWFYRKTGHVQK